MLFSCLVLERMKPKHCLLGQSRGLGYTHLQGILQIYLDVQKHHFSTVGGRTTKIPLGHSRGLGYTHLQGILQI